MEEMPRFGVMCNGQELPSRQDSSKDSMLTKFSTSRFLFQLNVRITNPNLSNISMMNSKRKVNLVSQFGQILTKQRSIMSEVEKCAYQRSLLIVLHIKTKNLLIPSTKRSMSIKQEYTQVQSDYHQH